MRVFVPFDGQTPKTSLAGTLTSDERQAFAMASLRDVIQAITAAGYEPTVLATTPVDVDVPVEVDTRALTTAVNDRLATHTPPVGIIMADLTLATPTAIQRLCAPEADVVIAPGQGGGTNAVVARHDAFRVDYHGVSLRDHRAIAADIGATLTEVDSYRLSTDIDTREDLKEVLLHTDGAAAQWLTEKGFQLIVKDDEPVLSRAERT